MNTSTTSPHPTLPNELNEVNDCEDRRYRAMMEGDIATLEKLLSDDMLYTHSSAKTDTKAEYLASLKSGNTIYTRLSRTEVSVRFHGEVAIINGHIEIDAKIDGIDRKLNNKFLNVWVKNASGWQMSAWASTPVPKA